MVDAGDSKSPAFGCAGSSPASGTNISVPTDLSVSEESSQEESCFAQVVELVDTLCSGRSELTLVGVRVSPWAPSTTYRVGGAVDDIVVTPFCRSGGIGRHAVFRSQWAHARGSSSLPFGTIQWLSSPTFSNQQINQILRLT